MGSSSSKYTLDETLPKPKAKYYVNFYGRMTPNSPDGEDLGLSEPAPCWDFPKSTDKTIIILPEWSQTKMLGMTTNHSWNHAAFDPNYQQQLNQFGITEEKYKMIISRLNPILVGFAPFTRDSETYITELRKHLTKCNQDFPQSKWSLQIHKFATELSSTLFFENVYHSIKITSANAEEPTAEGEEAPVAEEEEETAKPDSQSPETEQPCEAKQ